jgi:hypothetical protein
VVLAARSEQNLRKVAGECEAVGGQALVIPTDVTDVLLKRGRRDQGPRSVGPARVGRVLCPASRTTFSTGNVFD